MTITEYLDYQLKATRRTISAIEEGEEFDRNGQFLAGYLTALRGVERDYSYLVRQIGAAENKQKRTLNIQAPERSEAQRELVL